MWNKRLWEVMVKERKVVYRRRWKKVKRLHFTHNSTVLDWTLTGIILPFWKFKSAAIIMCKNVKFVLRLAILQVKLNSFGSGTYSAQSISIRLLDCTLSCAQTYFNLRNKAKLTKFNFDLSSVITKCYHNLIIRRNHGLTVILQKRSHIWTHPVVSMNNNHKFIKHLSKSC